MNLKASTVITFGLVLLSLFFIKFFKLGLVLSPFLAVLIAIGFLIGAEFLSRKTKFSKHVSLLLIFTILALSLIAFVSVTAMVINSQLGGITEKLVEGYDVVMQYVNNNQWSQALLGKAQESFSLSSISSLNQALSAFGIFFFTLISGIFIATQPKTYVKGLKSFLNVKDETVFNDWKKEVYQGLSNWLKGKLAAMLIISLATWLGLTVIGIEFALTLGLLAGLFSFIPNIGPLMALIPAASIALFSGGNEVWWVLGLFVLIQTLESYVLLPLINQESVSLPPAFTLTLQIFLGAIFGFWGLIVAAPIGVLMITSWPYLINKNTK